MALENPFLIPRNKEGFIDYKSIYQIIYTQLKQPYGILDELSGVEVYWLIEGHLEAQRDHYEMIASAMKVAGASVVSGKDMKLFESPEESEARESEVMTKEKRQEELNSLSEKFGEF